MWSSVASTVPAGPAAEDKEEPPESTADLQAALLRCLGEENNKVLRGLCGKLIKGACSATDFHTQGLDLFQRADNGGTKFLGLYRRMVLSLPDGDKRALLVSLVDEAVAMAAKQAESSNSPSDAVPATGEKSATQHPSEVAPLSTADSTPTTADATANGENGKAAEAEVDSAQILDSTRKATASTEKAILSVMAQRQAGLAKEKRALDMIRVEMAALSQQQNKEIGEVMTALGETDKDLYYLERDFKAAEAEYLKCKARCVNFQLTRVAQTPILLQYRCCSDVQMLIFRPCLFVCVGMTKCGPQRRS